jgi:hypothetical protein
MTEKTGTGGRGGEGRMMIPVDDGGEMSDEGVRRQSSSSTPSPSSYKSAGLVIDPSEADTTIDRFLSISLRIIL